MRAVALIGCGFVADLYMRSLALYGDVQVAGVYDRDQARQQAFCAYWGVAGYPDQAALLAALSKQTLVLNLTNPSGHFEVSQALLRAGFHVFSEKPLTLNMDEARTLHEQAQAAGLHLCSAPSSVLGEAAQTLGQALRKGVAGTPRLVYAELDDGFISKAPYKGWKSESGAPWPHADEFATGCTLEHAGYYLSWLIAWFGPVKSLTAASANLGTAEGAPDFSTATLFFASGMVARLSVSIIASHDHRVRVFGDKGVLVVKRAWDNAAPVRFHRRFTLRRRLLEHPLGKRIRLPGPTHPKVKRFGAAAMNFALGPVEALEALEQGRAPRLAGAYALHLNEVTLAITTAGQMSGAHEMQTSCEPPEPMPWAG